MEKLKELIQKLLQRGLYEEVCAILAEGLKLEYKCVFLKNGKHFGDDDKTRDIYTISLIRGSRTYSFEFGQSIMNSQYYKDIHGRTYTLSGECRTGNYKIDDMDKYKTYLELVKGKEPSLYDILSCLAFYNPGTFEEFCSEFGYDTDSRKALSTYIGVVEEWSKVQTLFNDYELEILREIV